MTTSVTVINRGPDDVVVTVHDRTLWRTGAHTPIAAYSFADFYVHSNQALSVHENAGDVKQPGPGE